MCSVYMECTCNIVHISIEAQVRLCINFVVEFQLLGGLTIIILQVCGPYVVTFLNWTLVEWYLVLIMTVDMNGHQNDTGSEMIGVCAHNRSIILG